MTDDIESFESQSRLVWEAPTLNSIDIAEETNMIVGMNFEAVDLPGS